MTYLKVTLSCLLHRVPRCEEPHKYTVGHWVVLVLSGATSDTAEISKYGSWGGRFPTSQVHPQTSYSTPQRTQNEGAVAVRSLGRQELPWSCHKITGFSCSPTDDPGLLMPWFVRVVEQSSDRAGRVNCRREWRRHGRPVETRLNIRVTQLRCSSCDA